MRKFYFLFCLLCQIMFIDFSMAQDVTEKSFICVEIVQDSVLNSFQSQRSANLKETTTSHVSSLLNTYLKHHNDNFMMNNEQILYDSKGNAHYRYDILYKGIPVHNYYYTVHSADDTLNTITGLKLFTEDVSVVPYITESEAIEVAKNLFPAQIYFFFVSELEERIKQELGDSSASYYPSPDLVIFKAANQLPILAYRMELSSVSPLFAYEVLIINQY